MTGRRRVLAAAAALAALGLTGATIISVAPPARAAAEDYVKYYQVGSSTETLATIAQKFLGSADRAADVYAGNVSRHQSDGGVVTRTGGLHAGWYLVLPWDAVGTGVKYGLLPTPTPPAPARTSAAPAPTRTTTAPAPPRRSTPARTVPAKKATKPVAKKKPPAARTVRTTCQAAPVRKDATGDWASLRLAADQAWTRTRGRGQTVAIVDSGADGTLPQLAGRTADGADVVGGTGRGNADCLGSGTAMAGIVAAQPVAGSPLVGLAPDATVLPIRVATTEAEARGQDVATAVRMAVTGGATVIVLGALADTNDRSVAVALSDAVRRGAVVVAPALTAGPPVDATSAKLTEGVLRVGGLGVDGRMMTGYRQGGVHLVAPGRDVTVLGITGVGILPVTGPQYAAAFVGATAALVRAAYPELSAAQVVRRLEATADRMPDRVPDGRYGYGLVSPRSAVDAVLAEESPPPDPAAVAAERQRDRRLPALIVIAVLAVVVATLLAIRVRRLVVRRAEEEPRYRAEPAAAEEPPDEPPTPTGVGAGSEWSREASGTGLAYWRERR